jgi:hypothetical protein
VAKFGEETASKAECQCHFDIKGIMYAWAFGLPKAVGRRVPRDGPPGSYLPHLHGERALTSLWLCPSGLFGLRGLLRRVLYCHADRT